MSAQLNLLNGRAELNLTSPEAKAMEVGYTPIPLIRQFIREELQGRVGFQTRFLDPCAGAGAFGVAIREHWGRGTHITAVEPRDEPLGTIYDEVFVGMLETFLATGPDVYNAILGNPPFSLTAEFVEGLRPLLKHPGTAQSGGTLTLLLPVDWWQRKQSLYEWARKNRWRTLHTIGGPVSFYGPGSGSAFQNYGWFTWDTGDCVRDTWDTKALPWLPPESRKWITQPGRT